jgi:hypothetical protein
MRMHKAGMQTSLKKRVDLINNKDLVGDVRSPPFPLGGRNPCLRPLSAAFSTPSWVRPGKDICEIHTFVGRTRGEQLIRRRV